MKKKKSKRKIVKKIISAVLAVSLLAMPVPFNAKTAKAGSTNQGYLPTSPGTTLTSGRAYTVSGSPSITGSSGQSALIIPSGGTVVINIPSGCVLTVNGGAGSDTVGGGAGIEVPSNATLIITGGGTLRANGGSAASGGDGVDGASGRVSKSTGYMYSGSGGSGGTGGGGAGAGIGGRGGSGKSGGSGGNGLTVYTDYGSDRNGNPGASGSKGGNGGSMGTLYALGSVRIESGAGSASTHGSGGGAGGVGNNTGYGWENWYSAAGGGGGGAGASGSSATAIGGGGGAGGSGGGGGGGAVFTSSSEYSYQGGYGGYGGYGNGSYAPNGSTARRDSYAGGYVSGGSAGGRGSNGDSGSSGQVFKSSSATVVGRSTDGTVESLSEVQYTVSFDRQGGSNGTTGITATFFQIMSNITVPSRNGYTFGGYYSSQNGGDTQYYNADGQCVRAWDQLNDATLYAKWTANEYTMTLDAQGGSGGTTVTATYDKVVPTGINIPSKPGYLFKGYYSGKNGTGTLYYSELAVGQLNYTVAGSITIYAKWEAIQYTISLDKQSGSGGTASTTAIYCTSMSNVTVPTRTGYTFGGYYSGKSGGGNQYYNESGSCVRAWDQLNDATLYAKWTANKYIITLDAQGGSGGTTAEATYDTTVPSGINIPSKPGYLFKGYYSGKNGTGTLYYSNQAVGQLVYKVVGPITLYAKWEPITYNIQLYSNGSFIKKLEGVTYGQLSIPSADELNLTRKHYSFMGWNIYDEQNWGMYQPNTLYNTGLTDVSGKTISVYAAWQILDNYTVTYNANGGAGIPNVGNVFAGEDYTVSDVVPTRENYTFVGWSRDSSAAQAEYMSGDTIEQVMNVVELYAVWKLNPTVSYNANGGIFSKYIEKTYVAKGKTVTAAFSNVPTKNGYIFAGWSMQENAINADYTSAGTKTFVMPEEDVVLYAVWTPKPIQIAYVASGQNFYSYQNAPTTTAYGTTYTFDVKVPSYVNSDKMTAAVNGNSLVTPSYTEGENGEKIYTYKIVQPVVDQSIEVLGCEAQTYSIRLNMNGGETSVPCTSYIYGNMTVLPGELLLSKTGYSFEGWYDNAACTGMAVSMISNTAFGDKEYYAKWEKNIYKVKFYANGGEGAMENQDIAYDEYTNLNKSTFTNGEYAFRGWSTSPYLVTPSYLDEEKVYNLSDKDDVILYAVWDYPSCGITYNVNGGTGNNTTTQYARGSDVDVKFDNIPERFGYTFAGWSETQNATTAEYTKDEANPMKIEDISDNYTLYAVWSPKSYSVVFRSNDGSDSIETQSIEYDAKDNLTKNSFTNTAENTKVFLGWTETGDVTQTVKVRYVDRQSVKNLSDTVDAQGELSPIDLYAVWGDHEVYYVSYDSNGGNWTNDMPTADMGDNDAGSQIVTVQYDNQPTRTGYEFAGWRAKTGELYTKEGETNTITLTDTNITLSAEWIPIAYTIEFEAASAESGVMEKQTIAYDEATSLAANAYVRSGYNFLGWALSEEGEVVFQNRQFMLNQVDHAQKITLYAVWAEKEKAALTYNTNGGLGGPTDATYAKGSVVPLSFSPVPKRTGYDFAGWSTKSEVTETDRIVTEEDANITLNQSTTYYAVWIEKKSYTVTYDVNGGNGSVPIDFEKYYRGEEAEVSFELLPSRAGYQFAGWIYGLNTYEQSNESQKIMIQDSNVVLKAKWVPCSYSVIFHNGSQIVTQSGFIYDTPKQLEENTFEAETGKTFLGWALTSDGGVTYEEQAEVTNLSLTDGGTVDLYAVWGAVSSTLKLDADGGTGESIQTATYGQELPAVGLYAPQREGYSFGGYWSGKNGTGKQYYSSNMEGMCQCDFENETTLYAKWTAVSYTISYITDGVVLGAQNVKYDTPFNVYSADFFAGINIPEGSIMAGWSTAANAATVEYYAGDLLADNELWHSGNNISLYTVIKKDEKYTLTYDGNGGRKVPLDKTKYNDNQKVTVNVIDEPVLNGYTFLGWASTPSAAIPEYSKEGAVNFPIHENTTLYAVWKNNTYTVTYDVNGGKGQVESQTLEYGDNDYMLDNGTSCTRTGYTLQGWGIAAAGTVQYDLGYQLISPLASKNGGIVKLYAIWKANEYEVTFDAKGGKAEVDTTDVVYGGTYGVLPKAERGGYDFKGWFTENANVESGAVAIISSSKVKTASSHTLCAKWERSIDDNEAPTAVVSIDDIKWNEYNDNLTYYIFTRDGLTASMAAVDTDSQVNEEETLYYVQKTTLDKRASAKALTPKELDTLLREKPEEWLYGEEVTIREDGYYTVYFMAMDTEGNKAFFNTSGFVISTKGNVIVNDETELRNAIAAGMTDIQMGDNITITSNLTIPSGVNVDTGEFSLSVLKNVVLTNNGNVTGEISDHNKDILPTATPTIQPSATPTVTPEATPTVIPSEAPTAVPTMQPVPTIIPSAVPTTEPHKEPVFTPKETPTNQTNTIPSVKENEASSSNNIVSEKNIFEKSNPKDIHYSVEPNKKIAGVTCGTVAIPSGSYSVSNSMLIINNKVLAGIAVGNYPITINYTDNCVTTHQISVMNFNPLSVIKKVPTFKMTKVIPKKQKFKLGFVSVSGFAFKNFTTSNKKVATISNSGVIKAKKKGKATITANIIQNGSYYRVVVKVKVQGKGKLKNLKKAAVKKVKSNLPVAYIYKAIPKKKSAKLTFSGILKGANKKFVSSNKKVASVSKSGKVKGKKNGYSVISGTIKQNSKKYQFKILVKVGKGTKKLNKKYLG